MKKVFIAIMLISIILLVGCGNKSSNNLNIDDINKMTEIPNDCASHERLLIEADNYLVAAKRSEILGEDIIRDYYYGMALSSVCSLRYAIENILYLKEYKDSLIELQNGAIYTDFDSIVQISFVSFWPYYFQGLIYELTGDNENSNTYYEIAKENELYYDADFYYLKNLTNEELLKIKSFCLTKEREIDDFFTPKTKLISNEPNGLEQFPYYHYHIMNLAIDEANYEVYKQSAINYLYSTPILKDGYIYAFLASMANEDYEDASYYITEGLWVFGDDPDINFYAGVSYQSKNMVDLAKKCFTKALNSSNAEIKAKAQEMLK